MNNTSLKTKIVLDTIREFEKLNWWKRWKLSGWVERALDSGYTESEIVHIYKYLTHRKVEIK